MPIRSRFSRRRGPGLALLLAAMFVASAQTVDAAAALPNGGSVSGAIVTTGQDSYEFTATAGDHIELRIADTGVTTFSPRIELRSPSAASIDTNTDSVVAKIAHDVTETGTFTVLVDDSASAGGSYTLYFARIPGANEHGLLINDGIHSEIIDVGDLDTYTLTASVGDHLELRIADINNATLAPQLSLYAPSGAHIGTGTDALAAKVAHTAAETGTFTVLIKDGSQVPRNSGAYNLYYARIPGANELGPMINDGVHSETIDLGDLDTYTLTASAGNHIELRIADIDNTGLSPQLSLYAPSGVLIDTGTDALAAKVAHTAVETGTFTVMVKDGAQAPRGSGNYNLYFARIPGANEHGLLTPGIAQPGTIDLGDLDTFTLVAATGETLSLELQKTSGTGSGRLELYDPAGVLVDFATSAVTASFDHLVAATGTYTVLVKDGLTAPRGSGDYILTYTTDAPPVPTMSFWMLLLLAATIAWYGLREIASAARQDMARSI